MADSDRTSSEVRLWGTEDNDNLDISDLVLKTDADGRLEVVSSASAGAKALGSSATVSIEAAVYTVAASLVAIVDKVVMTNGNDVLEVMVQWGHSEGGGALSAVDLLGTELAIPPHATLIYTGPIYMAATDELRFDASGGNDIYVRIYGREFSV